MGNNWNEELSLQTNRLADDLQEQLFMDCRGQKECNEKKTV